MTHKEILFDSRALDQWATEGGIIPPDEDEAESRRQSLAELRACLVPIVGDESNYALLTAVIEGTVTAAAFGDALGIHRSSAGRKIEAFVRRLRKKIASQPRLRDGLPSPWRETLRPE